MAKASRAYFVGERRYTPSQFRRLSRARKVEGMVEWFQARFTDPAHETPYNGREGGFLYVHGGPYDADDEIQNEFSDVAEFEAMEEAVGEVTSDGIFEWAPVRDGSEFSPLDEPFPDWDDEPPFDAGVAAGEVADGDGDWPPIIGVPAERRDFRKEVVASLDRFDALSSAVLGDRAHRSHNQPPELIEDGEDLPWLELDAARDAASELRAEAEKDEPDTSRIVSAIGRISDFAGAMGRWLGTVVIGGIAGGAAWDTVKTAYQNPSALQAEATTLINTATEWLGHLQTFW